MTNEQTCKFTGIKAWLINKVEWFLVGWCFMLGALVFLVEFQFALLLIPGLAKFLGISQ